MNLPDKYRLIQKECVNYLIERNYFSYDLYDALTNPYLAQIGNGSSLLRRTFIQINARSPVNLRFIGMQPMMHTKTITDLICYYSISNREDKTKSISELFHTLLRLKNKEFDAWGLNFSFTSRFGSSEPTTPNLYNTVHAGLAISNAFPFLSEEEKIIANNIFKGILNFIEDKLGFIDEGEKGWYLYYPSVKEPTYNVNALALYLLCYLNKQLPQCSEIILNRISKITEFLISEQNADGSWYYSRTEKGKWIDGFHTAFIIESIAFAKFWGYSNSKLENCLNKSIEFYLNKMITKDGFALYFYNGDKYPIESQNYAQTIQTLSCLMLWEKHDYSDLLGKVIENAITHLYSGKGYFYHKKGKIFTYKTSYARWSTAPMILAFEFANSLNLEKNLVPNKKMTATIK